MRKGRKNFKSNKKKGEKLSKHVPTSSWKTADLNRALKTAEFSPRQMRKENR